MLEDLFKKLLLKYSDDVDYNKQCWDELEKAYSFSNRYYHTLDHLKVMVSELEGVKSAVQNYDSILFSIFYHDIVYKATKSDNEYQSALWFEKRISKTKFNKIPLVCEQIESTKSHKLSDDLDTNILLDLDLVVLGKSPSEYVTYCQNIRKEYKIYPDFMYRKGRAKVLEHMLSFDSIYKTVFFKVAYENQAQENLSKELIELKK